MESNFVIDMFNALCNAIATMLDTDMGSVLVACFILCGAYKCFKELTKI